MYAGIQDKEPYNTADDEVEHLGLNLKHCPSGKKNKQSDGCVTYKRHVDMSGIERGYDDYASDIVDNSKSGEENFQ